MAYPNLSEIVTTTLRNRTGELADNMSRNNAALLRLTRRGNIKTFSGGRTIVQELNYANNQTYQWYSGYQTLNIQPSQVFSAAEYPIRQSAVAVSISGLEELQNSGEEAIIDLLESRIQNAEDTFMNGLSQGVYGDGSVANSVAGLRLLVATNPGSGTVGGIDRLNWEFWRNRSRSAATDGGVVLGPGTILGEMDALWVQLVRGRDLPDLIIADNNTYRYYLSALQAIQRVTTENSAPDMAEYGFSSLKYLQSDVVLDGGFQGFNQPLTTDALPPQVAGGSVIGGAPASTMYFLNTKYIHWRPHARRNMVPLDPDRFSVNQDAMVRLIGWAGNMTLSNAFLQGVLTS